MSSRGVPDEGPGAGSASTLPRDGAVFPCIWPSRGYGDYGLEPDSCLPQMSLIQSPALCYIPVTVTMSNTHMLGKSDSRQTLAYPITLEPDDGTLLATSPDFPELTTFGNDREEAVARAVNALEEAIVARIHDRREVPKPSGGDTSAPDPMLYLVPYDQLLHGRAGEER